MKNNQKQHTTKKKKTVIDLTNQQEQKQKQHTPKKSKHNKKTVIDLTNQQEQKHIPKKQTLKKTKQQKPKQTKGTRIAATKQQGTQLINRKKDYDKIIKEINTVYEKVRDYSYRDPYPVLMYIDEYDINIMKTFRKATGLNRDEARDICESLFENLVSKTYDDWYLHPTDDDFDEDYYEGDTDYYFYDVLKYNKKLLNKLLDNANDTILKNQLKLRTYTFHTQMMQIIL